MQDWVQEIRWGALSGAAPVGEPGKQPRAEGKAAEMMRLPLRPQPISWEPGSPAETPSLRQGADLSALH